jgi:hypothetical protein
MYVWFPDPEVGAAVVDAEVELEVDVDVGVATQYEGVTAAGTTQEQALEIAVGTDEHCVTKVGRPVVTVLTAVV